MTSTDHLRGACLPALAGLAALLLVSACERKSPIERVDAMRSRYTATVNESGFVATPHEPETSEEMAMEGAEGLEGGEEGEEGTEAAAPAAPPRYDILLDVIVGNDNRENLPRLTVDFVQVDSTENVKARWQVTFDTTQVSKGGSTQISHTLENIDYEAGDGFYTEVRQPVPPGERSEYPEYPAGGE